MSILLQKFDDKFIRNLQIDNRFYSIDISNNLYENYYKNNFETCVFVKSLITPEIFQFIVEFGQKINILVYHDSEPDLSFIESYSTHCKNMVHNKFGNTKGCIMIPYLINDNIFFKDDSIEKTDEAICFLDNIEQLPSSMISFLFPNSCSKKIKMFNNSKIPHYQNLGLVNEQEKSDLLKKYKYYINLNDQYLAESMVCGCVVLSPEELVDFVPKTYKHIPEHNTFNNFLKEVL